MWSDTCEAVAEAAEIALATHHDAPTDDTNETFFNAMDTLRDTIYETSRQKFREKASTTTATDPNSWRLVRAQKAAPPAPPNATLVVKGKPCVSEKAQAQAFARYYSEVSKRSKHSSKPAPIPDEECRHIPVVKSFVQPLTPSAQARRAAWTTSSPNNSDSWVRRRPRS